MLKRNSLTIFNVHSNTTALTANFSLVKGENRLAVYCILGFHCHAIENKIANHSVQKVQNLGNKRR